MARMSALLSLSLVVVVFSTTGVSLPSSEDATQRLLQHVEALEAKLEQMQVQQQASEARMEEQQQATAARMEAQQQASNVKINGLKAEVASLRTGKPVSLATERGCCTINTMPTSCKDLDTIGHYYAGFYTVKTAAGLQTIYCDFAKLNTQGSGFQTTIGLNNVKSSPVYFLATRDSEAASGSLTFSSAPLNIGGALDIKTGIFTAPVAGKYYFSFTGIARASKANAECFVYMYQNNNKIATGFCSQPYFTSGVGSYCTPKVQATINLDKGHTVLLQIGYVGSYLYDNTHNHYTQYTGWLIDEDVTSLLA